MTIKKHFVRFNLHFKQLKKWCIKMKNAIIMYWDSREGFSGQQAFLWFLLLFIYGLTVFCFHKLREALMIKEMKLFMIERVCRMRIRCTADDDLLCLKKNPPVDVKRTNDIIYSKLRILDLNENASKHKTELKSFAD